MWEPIVLRTLRRLDGSLEDCRKRACVALGTLRRGSEIEIAFAEFAPDSTHLRLRVRITDVIESGRPVGGPGNIQVMKHIYAEEIS